MVPNDNYFGSLLGYHAYSWCITEKPTFQNQQFFFPLFVACFRLVFLVVLLEHLLLPWRDTPCHRRRHSDNKHYIELCLGCLGAAIPNTNDSSTSNGLHRHARWAPEGNTSAHEGGAGSSPQPRLLQQ